MIKYMSAILFVLVMLPITSIPLLPYEYLWNVYEKENVVVWSEKRLSNNRVNLIQRKYLDIEYQFRSFNGGVCKCPRINVFLVSREFLNSWGDGKTGVFGRYFRARDTVFITPEMFNRPEFFAHELAHHFYYSCGQNLGSDDNEEVMAYKFQEYYRR